MVSIIIPNFNHAPYLKQRIDSVLSQTISDIEVIILDDCSTDNSREIIEQYREHPKLAHIILNTQNSGSTFKQWKKGIELAKGEFIWIAESDDVADDHFLESVLTAFDQNPETGLVYTQSALIDENNRVIGSMLPHTSGFNIPLWEENFGYNGIEFVKKFMLYQNSIPNASAVVFKKKIFEQAGGVDDRFTINGDWDLYTRIMAISDIYYIKATLNRFRMHTEKGSSGNVRNGNNIKEYYYLARKWKKALNLSAQENEAINAYIYKCWLWLYENKRRKLLANNFMNIIPAALQQDKKIFFRLLN